MKKEKIKKDMISERSLNRLLIGISKRRGHRDIEFPLTLSPYPKHEKNVVTMSSFWDSRNFMLIDYIGHLLANHWYKTKKYYEDEEKENYIPANPYNRHTNKIVIQVENQKDEIDYNEAATSVIPQDFNMCIEEKTIKQNYFFRNLSSIAIENLFNSTASCKFNFYYPIRVYNKQMKKFTENPVKIENENIFDCELASCNITPSGRRNNKKYKITFNTNFGRLFLYNLICINFDWITSKVDFFNLSETSQLIYRKYILSRNGFKHKRFKDCTIISGLGFMNKSHSENIKAIEKGLLVLKDNSLIKNWTYENNVFEFFK